MQRDDFRPDKPVTRGQWRKVAEETLRLLGERPPGDRLEATQLLARLSLEPSPASDEPDPDIPF